ncbi:MAG: amidohydrolase [Peptostreptococcaceae bacterium]
MGEFGYLFDRLVSHRCELNKIAEIGRMEFKTSKYIRDYLDKIGVEYKVYLDTGVAGVIKGKFSDKTIAFRADMDGLSTDDGAKHLCGHDGHVSILLGFIEYLNDNRDSLKDDIVFIFQPAEEGPGGAEELVDLGVLRDFKVDEIYGLHIYPEIAEGTVGVRDGYFMAQAGEFNIDVIGKGAHGAMPQNGVDAVLVMADMISSLHTIVSRNVGPIDNAVITIGKIQAGTVRNIVAETGRLEGTMRTFNPSTYELMKKRVEEVAKGFEQIYGCTVNVEINDCYPAVNNDKKLYEEFIKIIEDDKLIKLEPLMVSEDFSYYQREVPGLFFMLGSRNKEKGYVDGLHNINFNFDEKIFLDALKIYIKLLKSKKSLI